MIQLSVETIYPFLLAFLRAIGLLIMMPVLSGTQIPAMVRVGLAAMLALFCTAQPEVAAAVVPSHWDGLVYATVHELLAGLLLGWGARFLFFALEFAGQVMSTEIGLMLSNSLDPLSHQTSSPVGALLSWMATMIFLLSGAYRECIAAFVHSFRVFPPSAAFSSEIGEYVLAQSATIFSLAVQVATPVLAVNLFINFLFALLGRVAPSLEPYSASMPVRLVAGLTMLGLSLGLAAQLIIQRIALIPEQMLHFLR
jgi:flagellar biosynthetic protein FliR